MDGRHGLTTLLGDLVRGDRTLAGMLSVDDLREVLDDGILRRLEAGAAVPCEGPAAGSVFLVLKGRLREPADAEDGVLGPGDLIGTSGMLSADDPSPSARAETSAILVQIPREVAPRVFERVPRLMQRLFERSRERIVRRTLASAPVLSALDPDALSALAARATLTGHREGSDVLRSGDPGDTFHVMADGLAAVRQSVEGRPLNLALLRAGDYFGEWSLLTGAPRAATVTAITRTITVGIDRDTFLALIREHPVVEQRIDLEARSRYDRSAAFLARVESSRDVQETLEALEAVIAGRG